MIDLTLGTAPSADALWPIHVDNEPDLPDDCFTVYGTEGNGVGRTMVDGKKIVHHGIQIRVRAASGRLGYIKARQVAVSLDENVLRSTVTISGSTYTVQSVDRTGDVIRLGKQKPSSERSLFTINAVVSLRQLT
tara:strand:- start:6325 stop:6726 length:402 start_codon:yes stop_codon:yes gene_type:complete